MQINIFGTPDEIAEFIFNLQDISIEADDDVHEDAHEDAHEDEKEVSDADKFEAELHQLLKKYPQVEVHVFKRDSSE